MPRFRCGSCHRVVVRSACFSSWLTPFACRCACFQIYNERVYDLLAGVGSTGSAASSSAASGSASGDGSLSIRESASRGQYVEGLTEAPITSVAQAQALLRAGAKARRVAATAMNHESSRSHAVFTLSFESADRTSASSAGAGAGAGGGRLGLGAGAVRDAIRSRSAQFHLIDLAGSERQKSTGAAGDRLKEAGAINRSLSALAGVIAALVDVGKGKARHVPYRDSKLVSAG